MTTKAAVLPKDAANLKENKQAEPAKQVEEAISEFDKAELLKILDELIFNGEYTEEVKIKGRLKIVFRTRTADEVTTISKELDNLDFKLVGTLQEQRALHNLAYSLIEYNDKDLRAVKSIPDKYKLISQLPIFVVSAMADALAKFDRKINAACSEQENF